MTVLVEVEALAVVLAVSAANNIERVVGAHIHHETVAKVLALAVRIELGCTRALTLSGDWNSIDLSCEDLLNVSHHRCISCSPYLQHLHHCQSCSIHSCRR